MSDAAEKPAQIDQMESEQDIERVLLSAAGAIQRLVAQRNALRSRVDTLERELTRLRHQTLLIHDSYRTLTTEFITQFQVIDKAIDLFREPTELAGSGPAEQQPAEVAASDHPDSAERRLGYSSVG